MMGSIETKRPHYFRETEFGTVEPVYELTSDNIMQKRWKVHEKMVVRGSWRTLWRRYNVLVSTVFLAIDHAFRDGPPVLYETMLFSQLPAADEKQWRYTTRTRAAAGHAKIVRLVYRRQWKQLGKLAYLDHTDAK